jgi:hypothetical protein
VAAAWLSSAGSVVVEGVRIALTVVEFRRVECCRGCEGRGWRLASSASAQLAAAERVRRFARRACPECLGVPVVGAAWARRRRAS